ncbi:MAG: hypothetical protein ICV54_18230 [Nostoc sp. C3-bin3]|nr:hypothetical protein [Nostoc sp. C3-bin3]
MKTKFSSLVIKSVVTSFATTPVNIQTHIYKPLADLFPLLVGTEIFPQQEEHLVQLHHEIRFQINKIFTPIQQSQFEAALEEGGDFRDAFCAMNVSSQEQAQLRRVFQISCIKLANLLTPQQEIKILQNLQERYRNASIKNKEIVKLLTGLLEISWQPSTVSG